MFNNRKNMYKIRIHKKTNTNERYKYTRDANYVLDDNISLSLTHAFKKRSVLWKYRFESAAFRFRILTPRGIHNFI